MRPPEPQHRILKPKAIGRGIRGKINIRDNCFLINQYRGVKRHTSPIASDLKSYIGFWLRFVSNHVSHSFARKLASTGVTVAEWVIISELFETEETSPSRLAASSGLTRGAVSKLIDRLLHKELVSRTEAGQDRRFQDVKLTAAGRALVPKLAALADRNDEEFFSHLSTKEKDALVATLKKLVVANKLKKVPTT
jgi:DNA-binding MarR family transcriptional regulator